MYKMKPILKLLLLALVIICEINMAKAENEERKLPSFTEISLRIPGKLIVRQGDVQKVTIEAKESTLKEIITEVNGRALIIRFPSKNYFWKNFDPGRIDIYITIPEVTGLNVSGSGDIIGEGAISAIITELSVSGSGNLTVDKLNCDRVKAVISGSGNIVLGQEKPASEFHGVISGSGNIKAGGFEAQSVNVTISGSGNCSIKSNGDIKVKIAGSGNLYYTGNPNIDSAIAGSGNVKKN
jgi:hypothetical protein